MRLCVSVLMNLSLSIFSSIHLTSTFSIGSLFPLLSLYLFFFYSLSLTLYFSHGRTIRYSNHNEFARDVRRCVGNFLHYNYGAGFSKMRRDVCRVLFNFETSWKLLKVEVRETDIHTWTNTHTGTH